MNPGQARGGDDSSLTSLLPLIAERSQSTNFPTCLLSDLGEHTELLCADCISIKSWFLITPSRLLKTSRVSVGVIGLMGTHEGTGAMFDTQSCLD